MFDPTIFDNLKVVLEGVVYDLDLSNQVQVTNRKDLVDLATMGRTFSVHLQVSDCKTPYPLIELAIHSTIKDFALEKIDGNEKEAGCNFDITFFTKIYDPQVDCPKIERTLNNLWGSRPKITQEISYLFHSEGTTLNKVVLHFGRKINEDQIDDLQPMVELGIKTLHYFTREFG